MSKQEINKNTPLQDLENCIQKIKNNTGVRPFPTKENPLIITEPQYKQMLIILKDAPTEENLKAFEEFENGLKAKIIKVLSVPEICMRG